MTKTISVYCRRIAAGANPLFNETIFIQIPDIKGACACTPRPSRRFEEEKVLWL